MVGGMKTVLILIISLVLAGCAHTPTPKPPCPWNIPAGENHEAMSVADSFLYHQSFPFCTDDAGDPSGTFPDMDYVVFPVVSGDEGLAAAMAIFWNSESVSFSPSVVTNMFNINGRNYDSPNPDATNLISYYSTWGAIAEGYEPRYRVCPLSIFSDPDIQPTSPQNISWIYGDAKAVFLTLVRYVSGEWRLYYKLLFSTFSDELLYCNPQYATNAGLSGSGYAQLATGSISVFGQSLSWEIWANLGQTLTSNSFTASDVSWTY